MYIAAHTIRHSATCVRVRLRVFIIKLQIVGLELRYCAAQKKRVCTYCVRIYICVRVCARACGWCGARAQTTCAHMTGASADEGASAGACLALDAVSNGRSSAPAAQPSPGPTMQKEAEGVGQLKLSSSKATSMDSVSSGLLTEQDTGMLTEQDIAIKLEMAKIRPVPMYKFSTSKIWKRWRLRLVRIDSGARVLYLYRKLSMPAYITLRLCECDFFAAPQMSYDRWPLKIRSLTQPENQVTLGLQSVEEQMLWLRELTIFATAKTLISEETLLLGKVIGAGGSGRVMLGQYFGTSVAVKELYSSTIDPYDLDEVMAEITTLARLNHPNIIRYFGACATPCNVMLVMELAFCALDTLLYGDEEFVLSEDFYYRSIKGIAAGMAYLHELELVHRDLKPGNVLLDKGFHAKICDLGISRSVSHHDQLDAAMTATVGTPWYMAPEVIDGQAEARAARATKVDVYSFGILVWEMYTRRQPYSGVGNAFLVMEAVARQGRRPKFREDDRWPPQLANLVSSCWQTDPDARPGFAEILNSEACLASNRQHPDASGVLTCREQLFEDGRSPDEWHQVRANTGASRPLDFARMQQEEDTRRQNSARSESGMEGVAAALAMEEKMQDMVGIAQVPQWVHRSEKLILDDQNRVRAANIQRSIEQVRHEFDRFHWAEERVGSFVPILVEKRRALFALDSNVPLRKALQWLGSVGFSTCPVTQAGDGTLIRQRTDSDSFYDGIAGCCLVGLVSIGDISAYLAVGGGAAK